MRSEESSSYDHISNEIVQGRQEKQDLQTGSKSSSVELTPVGADVVPSSVFANALSASFRFRDNNHMRIHPTIVAILTYLPAGSARCMDVRAKSPSMDCPVDDPTLALKTSSGSDLMQSNLSAADELTSGLHVVFVISVSKVDWKAVVFGAVSGKAPPL